MRPRGSTAKGAWCAGRSAATVRRWPRRADRETESGFHFTGQVSAFGRHLGGCKLACVSIRSSLFERTFGELIGRLVKERLVLDVSSSQRVEADAAMLQLDFSAYKPMRGKFRGHNTQCGCLGALDFRPGRDLRVLSAKASCSFREEPAVFWEWTPLSPGGHGPPRAPSGRSAGTFRQTARPSGTPRRETR